MCIRDRPESAALVVLAACLLAIGWAWFAWSATLLVGGGPLPLDRAVFDAMVTLRNPLADRLMAALASLGDVQVLLPASLLVLLWLTWRRRWMAAGARNARSIRRSRVSSPRRHAWCSLA